MKTVKDLAKELGVSDQTIRNEAQNQNLKTTKQGIAFVFGDDEAASIAEAITERKEAAGKSKQNSKPKQKDELLLILEKELESKNKQIEVLQEQNSQLVSALADATASLKAAQALHAGTMQQSIEKHDDKKWWQFWK